jgi:flagellar basal-body rod modification protein FlgD
VNATEAVGPGLLALAGASSAGATKSTQDHDTFLQLLVAQLRYQDPMNPTDSSQFMAQNAQFTALEKMQDVADGVNQLLSAQLSFGAANMLGKQVSYVGADGAAASGVPTGVSFLATGPVLTINGVDVPVSSVTAVGTPSASLPGTSTSPSTSPSPSPSTSPTPSSSSTPA